MLRVLLFCVALALSTAAQAATVVWSATINGFDLADGTDVAVGALVRVGTFDLSDSQIAANSQNVPFLDGHFTEFGSTTIGSGGAPAGLFSTITTNNSATASTLAGSQIYVWAFSSGTVLGSTQQGIFYMPKSSDVDWQFPAQVPLPETTQIGMDDLTDAATSTSLRANAKVVVGSFGPGTSAATGKPNFTLVAVPEPASAPLLLAAGGVVGCIRRRR
jgi:hypothetical protein